MDDREDLKRRVCWAIDQADNDEYRRMGRDRNYLHDWLQYLIGWISDLLNILGTLFGRCCFISSAAVKNKGLPDNCQLLNTLRKFRDDYMFEDGYPERSRQVYEYYKIAPHIVECVDSRDDAQIIWQSVFSRISEAASLIDKKKFIEAEQCYRELFNWLKRKTICDC